MIRLFSVILLFVLACAFRGEDCSAFAPEMTTYDFGERNAGEQYVSGKIPFRNKGTVPLVILRTEASTGGMVAWTTRQPIPPGHTDTIHFTFDIRSRTGFQEKTINVGYNDSCHTVLRVKGKVTANPCADLSVQPVYEFDTVSAGTRVKGSFPVKNTGTDPLIIYDVKTSTGAMVASWPKEPLAPGQEAEITFLFDTSYKNGNQQKTITVQYDRTCSTVLHVKGYVKGDRAGQ